MIPLTSSQKQKIISRLFWDMQSKEIDVDVYMEEKFKAIETIQSRQFFRRLLTSCDWYTLLKLIGPERLPVILGDTIIDELFPHELKKKYKYARDVLSR